MPVPALSQTRNEALKAMLETARFFGLGFYKVRNFARGWCVVRDRAGRREVLAEDGKFYDWEGIQNDNG